MASSGSLSAAEGSFLKRAMRYFGIRAVQVDVQDRPGDIAVMLGSPPLIMCRRRWLTSGPGLRGSKLAHELLHVIGYPHSTEMRRYGYYSQPERDRLSPAVYRDILRGTPRFRPERFGLREPRRT